MKTDYLKFSQALKNLNKTYFTRNDLKKFYQGTSESLKVLLSGWQKKKLIHGLGRGYYAFDLAKVDELRLANDFDTGSYVSLEYALSYYNLIDQAPSVITLVTKNRSRIIKSANWTFEYTHLKENLLFGYELKNGVYIASPEKALADLLYLLARGKRTADLTNLEKDKINLKNLKNILRQFPKYVREKAAELDLM